MTGRLPDAVALHFLGSGLVGEVPVEPARLAKARAKIERAAAGIRARDYTPTPDPSACSWCAFRDICPASAANPARALGIQDRVGTLEPGRMADFVLWGANPFSVYALAERVWIDGAPIWDRADPRFQQPSDFLLGQPGQVAPR